MMKMKDDNSQRGISLIEVLVAVVVTVVGIVAVANMILYGIGLQVRARDNTMATGLAKSKIEELSISLPTVGGDLDNNLTGFNDAPSGFTRRWLVTAGPANTLDVTIRVIAENPTAVLSPVVDIQVLLETN